jgi:hypothetical protein
VDFQGKTSEDPLKSGPACGKHFFPDFSEFFEFSGFSGFSGSFRAGTGPSPEIFSSGPA